MRRVGAGSRLGGLSDVVLPGVGDLLAAQEAGHDLQRLGEAVDPLLHRDAEGRELGSVPPRTEAEDQPSAAHVVGCGGHLGHQHGIAERAAHHERAYLHPLGDGGDGGQLGPGFELAGPAATRFVEEVVEHPDRVQAAVFCAEREVADPGPGGPCVTRAVHVVRVVRGKDRADLHPPTLADFGGQGQTWY